MQIKFSFVVPVYNRPDEIEELLESLAKQTFQDDFEVVIVEDGSTIKAESVVAKYAFQLNVKYLFKENSGPGDSRNYGMQRASGNYFIILDSDCILPEIYLENLSKALKKEFVHCFGGPDGAHASFTNLQKAINYSMTSFLTTGGIRGGKKSVNTFQPRSFNMGISKEVFQKTKGYGRIWPGEDPDLTMRIWKEGYKTRLIPEVYVFHKRRIDWKKFYKQVHKFGLVRPILNVWHPKSAKITYWFPTVFYVGLLFAITLSILLKNNWLLIAYGVYFIAILVDALIKTRSLIIAILSIIAVCIQFLGYGWGFLKSSFYVGLLKNKPETRFPELFFKK